MPHDLSHWVRSIRGQRVVVVGDLILDRYVYGDAERISPEAPVPVLRTVERHEAVGGSANVAACLVALGCKVACCGVIGQDRHGETLARLLREIGVDTSGLQTLPSRPTTTKTRLVGLAQHRHRQQLLRIDEEETGLLPAETVESLGQRARAFLSDAGVVCVEDYDKGVVTASLVERIVADARQRGCPVFVDPARRHDFERYRGVSVVTPNRDELSIAAGRSFKSLEDLAGAAEALRASLDLQAVVTTVDREGSVLVETGQPWRHLSTVPRSVYDNTGAGDAVLGMLAGAIAAGADMESATRLSNVAGGLEVEKFGCVPISADEILAELRLEDRLHNGKLRSVDELLSEIRLRRDRGETVAFTNGCFDILHAGHVDLLKRCRREASLLIVAMNSDASVRRLAKGGGRPIHRFEHRAAVVGALECVDYVVGFEEDDPEAVIRRIKPDVLLKGGDWADKGVVGRAFVESIGGRVVLLPLVEGLSTTRIIEQLRHDEKPTRHD